MSSPGEISTVNKIHSLCNSIDDKNYESIRGKLETVINELINKDFSLLVQLLYRIDVDEKQLKQYLFSHPGADSSVLITDLIIKRQLQKITTRDKFSGTGRPPDSRESW